jgi:hypothetical protein
MSNKIKLDKYYTPDNVVNTCLDLVFKFVPKSSFFLEPSAGAGAFSLRLLNCLAYDIEPEHESIKKADFLKVEKSYVKNLIVLGNPPFGNRNNLALKFFKHSLGFGDYIAFILPISQLNNLDSLYEFDLISSTDLGAEKYSEMPVHCCFNIYKRPISGVLNKKPKLSSKVFRLLRTGDKGFQEADADFMFCKRGSAGKEIKVGEKRYSDEYKVMCFKKEDVRYVKDKILSFDWANFKNHQSSPNISKNDVYRLFLTRETINKQ